ncbi:MAG: iron-sulfur cluster assembly scaffold protein [Deltaproteobacteria bacterium]|nr:MAG: iron-sulfur cluster assembly scaffold protein [Deltaproteobacteria bacterium]
MSGAKRLSDEEFDALVNSIQEQSFMEAKEAYGEKGFARWRNPKFSGVMDDADCSISLTGKCGDTIQMFLKFDGDQVARASYTTTGCASSQLAGSFTAELAIGRSVEQLFSITPDEVVREIGKLPANDQHCAELSVQVLHECANKYMLEITDKS